MTKKKKNEIISEHRIEQTNNESGNQWITNISMQPLTSSLRPQTNATPNRMYSKYVQNIFVNVVFIVHV